MIDSRYATTAALYVGIPALLAIGLSFVPTPRTITGNILLWTTLYLLAIGILAVEGLICILIVLPFFLAIGFIIGIFIDRARAKDAINRNQMRCSLLTIFALMSLEGVNDTLSFNRKESIVIKRTTQLTAKEFEEKLAIGPRFDEVDVPHILSLLFPTPLPCQENRSLALGSQWTIPFDHGGDIPRNLTVRVTEKNDYSVVFTPVQDETEYGNWLTWKAITWKWTETESGQTEFSATFDFERRLDPAFYFGPLQRWGVSEAGELFVDAIVGP